MLLIDTGEQRQVPHLIWIFRTVGFGVSDCRLRTGVGEWVGGVGGRSHVCPFLEQGSCTLKKLGLSMRVAK